MSKNKKKASPTVAIFADGQNINLFKHSQPIIAFAKTLGRISQLSAYHNWRQLKETKAQKLLTDGWLCIDIAGNGKNKLDALLIQHCQRLCSTLKPDVVVLVTGDSDFRCLIETCQRSGQRVVVIGRRNYVSHCFHRLIPKGVHYLEDLRMAAIV